MSKANHERDDELTARGIYVYCVGTREALAPLLSEKMPCAIEEDSGLELIEAGELAAVVSRVPLADYGEDTLAERLQDATWTATRALRHERVAEHFARHAPVVPLRFGTIYLRRAPIVSMLEERGAQLLDALRRLEGREEWGLNVYVERARLREEVARLSPRMREMTERADASAPGQAYLLRKKIDALRDEEARAVSREVASEIETALAAACEGAARLRVFKDEATERGELSARLAFLIARERFEEFRIEAERIAAKHAPAGFTFELTGPWPAYNFVDFDDETIKGKDKG